MASSGRDPFYEGPTCPRCNRGFGPGDVPDGITRCYGCLGEFEAARFNPPPPLARIARVATAGPGGATACPQHPGNVAVGHCERCGILTCSLCQIETDRMLLCPACFERLSDEGTLASTRVHFRNHARLATSLAILGLLIFVAGVASGPAVLGYALYAYRRGQRLNEPTSGWRLAIVVILGLAQFVFGAWFVWAVAFRR